MLVACGTLAAFGACKGEERESSKSKRSAAAAASTPAAASAPATIAIADPARPRYLRVNGQGVLVDATRFPSVPASIVEKEVRNASDRRDVARILHRFGVNPAIDRGGEIAFIKASLVDGLERERLLVVTLIGEVDDEGFRLEDDVIVFLATTDDERLIGLGSDSISARTRDGAPIGIDLVPLHDDGVDDLVATWSSCGPTAPKACHGMRAWTMDRGYPERIVDLVGEAPFTVGSEPAAPHDVISGGAVRRFDPLAYAYK